MIRDKQLESYKQVSLSILKIREENNITITVMI